MRLMLDPYRNQEVQSLPNFAEILSDERENTLELVIEEGVKSDMEEVIRGLKALVEKEAARPKGVRFSAITEIVPGDDPNTIVIKMLEQSVPQLKEVRKGHFVSCLIYDYNYWEKEGKTGSGEGMSERSKVYPTAN